VRELRVRRLPASLLVLAALLLLPLLAVLASPLAHAATSPVTGGITGPTNVGQGLKAKYVVNATGGPAIEANGTQNGTFSFHAYFLADNTTGALFAPPSGVLVNGTVTLDFTAPNITESATLSVLVTSANGATNASTNFTLSISIVQPMRLSGVLVVSGAAGVAPFDLTVTLDGAPVGSVAVPSLAAGATYPIDFAFVAPPLASGWHTLAVALGSEHGLVSFAGGAESISQSFYVTAPTPSYTIYFLAGFAAFLGVIVIWTSRVGARRRGRTRS
jgi:hypothetical protein